MNYKEMYDQLVVFRKQHKLVKSNEEVGKIEEHHILPRCCGGTDDPENLVNLYAKEHFMAHYYLWKIYENDKFGQKLLNAFWMMCIMSSASQERTYQEYVKMSEEYQDARTKFAKQQSETISNKVSANKNGHFGKHWYYDPLTNESHRYVDGKQPNGWILGRVFSNTLIRTQQKQKFAKKMQIQIKKQKRQKELQDLQWYYEQFQKYGFEWLSKNYPHTYQTFIKDCKKHLPGFKSQKGRQRKFEAPIR